MKLLTEMELSIPHRQVLKIHHLYIADLPVELTNQSTGFRKIVVMFYPIVIDQLCK